ncbi:MAG: signal peptidase I [Moraxella sp.]|nr:signal peptidase I [Moraxella sp.]
MEFDINLILVPVTLVLLVAYLVDKLWLKQHGLAKKNTRQVALAQNHLEECKKALESSLKQHYGVSDVERFSPTQSAPTDVVVLHENYHAAKHRLDQAKGDLTVSKEFSVIQWAYEYLPILLTIILLRSFVVQPFNIPSSSMVPSLYTGDFILVNMSAYGLRLPITHTKILSTGSPQRGDVVVFRYPLNEKRYYIKRMIGVSGDTIRFENDTLFVNGKKVATSTLDYRMPEKLNAKLMPETIGTQTISDEERRHFGKEEEKYARYYQETLGEHTYNVRYVGDLHSAKEAPFLQEHASELKQSQGTSWQITVPDGQYFVMGDNRDRSEDGRFWGFVPEKNLAGKATYIWMHKDPGLSMPSFGRAGAID